MRKSKLIVILKTFRKAEIKKFDELVSSPFFNKEKVLERLAGILRDHFPDFDNPELEKENVFAKLYPGKKYNDALMRNIISDLLRLAEEYLLQKKLDENDFRKEMMLLHEFHDRKLSDHFLKQRLTASRLVEKRAFKDEIYYDSKTELSRLYSLFLKETEDTFTRENEIYQEASDFITASFLIKILYYNTYMLTRQSHISNFSFKLNFSEEIDTFFDGEGKRFLKLPFIEVNYLSFKLIQTGDEKYFYLLKDTLIKHFDSIDAHERKNIQTVLENYCYAKVTEGKIEFVKEQFRLYRESVEKGTHIGSPEYISNIFFMSIVATGLEAGEFNWIERFMKEKIHSVKEALRPDTEHFSKALWSYWKKDYESSLSELSKVSSEDFAFKHNIKSLTLKVYYDLNESEPFYSHIDTYKHFILNNKAIHDKVREQVNNFINYSKKLYTMKNLQNTDREFDIMKLKREISENHSLINKIWLLKKADEI